MRVTSARYVKSALGPGDYPKEGLPECAFGGRSNVGKSTLLNALLRRKGLAKTSRTPGKTRTINFFDINGQLCFVDLPGYGYAKVSKAMKDRWARAMTAYLREREALRLVVQLVDARHAPTEQDCEMLELLDESEVPVVLAATKIDKVKRGHRARALEAIRKTLELPEDALVIPFSSVTGEGVRPLWQVIEALTLGKGGEGKGRG